MILYASTNQNELPNPISKDNTRTNNRSNILSSTDHTLSKIRCSCYPVSVSEATISRAFQSVMRQLGDKLD